MTKRARDVSESASWASSVTLCVAGLVLAAACTVTPAAESADTAEVGGDVGGGGETGGADGADSSGPGDGDGAVGPEDMESDGGPDSSDPGDGWDAADTAPPDEVGPDLMGPDLTEPDASVDAAVDADDTAGPDLASPPCEVALTAVAPTRWARARQLRVIEVTGGTDRHRHRLLDAPSGAIINPMTGEYVSGPTVGVTDRVLSADLGCADEVITEVRVVEDLVVAPGAVGLRSGSSFRPRVSAGSGAWELRLAAPGGGTGSSVAAIGDGGWRFVAGPRAGSEALQVVDLETGEVVTVPVEVGDGASFAAIPPLVIVPGGATLPVVTLGGSGHFEVSVELLDGGQPADDPDAAVAPRWVGAPGPSGAAESGGGPARWEGGASGGVRATLTDSFTGEVAHQVAVGLGGVGPEGLLSGQQLELWTAAAPGDVDGDGFADAVVGAGEVATSHPQSGAVLVYAGGAERVAGEPARVIAGGQRSEQLGAAVGVGDFDGDGRVDLAVGGPRFRVGAVVSGRVQVFMGQDGRFFSEAPGFEALGERNGDLFGHTLAVCDFDGDGYDDLAVGAFDAEDTARAPVVSNQGAVYLFPGGPGGLMPAASQVLFGALPVADGFAPEVDLRFGRVVEAGDLDGDGACELLVGSWAVGGDDGVAWVFAGGRGESAGALVAGVPARVWRGTRAGRFGWALAAGDLDGDGVGDLVVGQPRWSTSATVADNHGAVRVKAGGSWVGGVASVVLDESDFDATLMNPGVGANDINDEWGFRLAVGEVTGDGRPDLLVAAIADEVACAGCGTNAGAVHVLAGREEGWPVSTPSASMTSTTGTDRQGSAIAVLGEADGSGQALVLSVAGREDSVGADFGRVMVFSPMVPAGQFGAAQVTLGIPSLPQGWRVAQALEVIGDLDGDGHPELVLGAPQGAGAATTGVRSAFSGFATVHRGTPGGFVTEPGQVLSGFRRHSAADRWGFELQRLDDFDGDGRPELAMVGRSEDMATSYGAGTISTAACNVARTDSGAVAVFGTTAGEGGRVEDQPMVMVFGPQASQVIETLAAGDLDGDGLTDLVYGSRFWDRPGTGTGDNGGGFEVLFGRARAHPTSTSILCEPDRRHFGRVAADGMAASMVAVGDLDGDGCDELAVGIVGSDLIATNSGAVEIFFGAGAGCASQGVRRLVIAAPVASTGLGNALSAVDLDGDGRLELAVGGSTHRVDGVAVGGAWVVSGEALAAVAEQAVVRADELAPTPVRLFGAGGLTSAEVTGRALNELFGVGVGLVPGDGERPHLLAVASSAAVMGGAPVSGVVTVYRVALSQGQVLIEGRPLMVIGGEPHGALPTAKMAWLPGGGAGVEGGRRLLVGASESSARAPFSGALWVVPVDALVGSLHDGGEGGEGAR